MKNNPAAPSGHVGSSDLLGVWDERDQTLAEKFCFNDGFTVTRTKADHWRIVALLKAHREQYAAAMHPKPRDLHDIIREARGGDAPPTPQHGFA